MWHSRRFQCSTVHLRGESFCIRPRGRTNSPRKWPPTRGAKLQESNEWTVRVAGGLLEGTNIRFAAEMTKVLDDRPNLRVLPIVTYGALGNVEDLLYLKGIDITITLADVLDEYIKNRTFANIQNRIRHLCRFLCQRNARLRAAPNHQA
jgi:hypothetical protein